MKEFFTAYGEKLQVWALTHGARIAVVVILVLALVLALRFGIRSFLRFYLDGAAEGSAKEKRVKTLSRVLGMAGTIVIVISGSMMALAELGLDLKPLLASAGIGGLALGFGAQTLVKDLISGFFILLEDQIRVGDVVEAGGRSGLVESVGLRVLVMRDLSGNRIVVPNGEIRDVVNMTYQYSRYVFKLGVAYKEDVDRVMAVIREVGDGLAKDEKWKPFIKEPMEILGLDQFGESALVIVGRLTTVPIQQWAVGREFNRRIKMAFDEKGIEIPFPHRTVFFGNAPGVAAKSGDAD